MAQPFAATLTTSASSFSGAIALDPTARVTNITVIVPSSIASQGTATLQVTLDSFQGMSNPTPVWAPISSTWISSAIFQANGGISAITYTILSPIAGLRFYSSNFGSTTAWTAKVLQEIIA
jgi:hypothetical protein